MQKKLKKALARCCYVFTRKLLNIYIRLASFNSWIFHWVNKRYLFGESRDSGSRTIFLAMKLCVVLFLFAIVQTEAKVMAQDITLGGRDMPIESVIYAIKKQTGYGVSYSKELLRVAKPMTFNVKKMRLQDFLNLILINQPIRYKITERNVFLSLNTPVSNNIPVIAIAPAARIRINVKDSTGAGLSGATIQIAGKNKSTTTDNLGQAYLDLSAGDKIIISYVGYKTEVLEITGNDIRNQVLNAILKVNFEGETKLEDLVVIGYGTAQKKDITGSVAQVNVQDMSKAPVASITESLAGRVAGLNVSASQGQPGEEGVNIRVRGVGSLTQDASPLFVIDGFAFEGLDLSQLNPEDVASINVLKDASATAIYGSRGANGVIVIETKKGKAGKPDLVYSGSLGFQDVTKRVDVLGPYEFVKLELERDPITATEIYLKDGATLESYKNIEGINWQDQFFKKGNTNLHNLSLRGGNADTKYAISLSLYGTGSVIVNTGLKKQQGRISIDQNINRKLKAGLNTNFTHTQSYGQIASSIKDGYASSALLYSVWGYRPVNADVLNGDDNLTENLFDEDVVSTTDFRVNPVQSAKNVYRKKDNSSLVTNAYVSFEIIKNLVFKATGAINLNTIKLGTFYNSKTREGSPANLGNSYGQWGSMANNNQTTWSNENTLTYTRAKRTSALTLLGGFSLQQSNSKGNGYTAVKVPNESLGIDGLGQGSPLLVSSFATYNTLQSYFTRVNYSYRSRYLLTGTFRADGSSKFPNNKWGYFPSGAVAWKMKEESFLKGIDAITEAKLRLSYGLTGNNRVGDFSALSPITVDNTVGYSFGNQVPTPAALPGIGNPGLKWETTAQLNLGYDLALLNDRIQLVVDLYRKKTDNLLLLANMPPSTGYTRAYKNIGQLKNEGLEFTLNTVNLKNKQLGWTSNFNISFNRNTVLHLADGEDRLLSNISPRWQSGYADPALYLAAIGHSLGNFVGYIFDGIYQYEDFYQLPNGNYQLKNDVPTNGLARANIKPGYVRYKDLNNDGVITAADQTVIGRGLPVHTGGFSNNFSYKGFTLNVFFQWSYGNDVYNANKLLFEGKAYMFLNQYADYANRWSPTNPSNTIPVVGGFPEGYYSTRELEDASYLRLKTVALDYNIPVKYLRRVGIKSMAITAATQNLVTWTRYSGMDPEVSTRNSILTPGFDFSAFPIAKTIVFGIKASF